MTSRPVLSICIATMNRAGFIGETLEALIAQIDDRVEVVVLDGGSKDATPEVVNSLARRHPQIRYVRKDAASGVDRDFDMAVQAANGEYCWLMSDDDILKPGAIDAVLERMKSGRDLLLVNAEVRTTDLRVTLKKQFLSFPVDRSYSAGEMDELFRDSAAYLSFIGCVIIRRQLWIERERERYYGSLFIHVGVIFQAALPNGAEIIVKPFIIIRYGNAQWSGRGFEIWMFKWPDLIWSFPQISDTSKSAVTLRSPWRKTTTLMLYRAKGAYSRIEYTKWLRQSLPWRGRLKAWLIASAPGVVANIAVAAYLKIVHPAPAVALFELRHSRFHVRNVLRKV